jgi:fructose-1,6-bisphosphatase I
MTVEEGDPIPVTEGYEGKYTFAFVKPAGGRAIVDDGTDFLDSQTESLHQRLPLVIGSRYDVDMAQYFLAGKP